MVLQPIHVSRILPPGQHELAIVVHALDGLGLDLCPAQCRHQQQRRYCGNDGNDGQQLDQRETAYSEWLEVAGSRSTVTRVIIKAETTSYRSSSPNTKIRPPAGGTAM